MRRKAALLLAAALLSTTVLAGCGGGSKSGQTAGSEQSAAAGETTGGTSLAVQIGPDPETIDPALNSAIDGGNLVIHAFETLLIFDDKNNIVPGQAESYEVSEDGLTYTFHLRKDLKWSDGSPLTAKDFVYSFKRVADPATAAPYGYDMLCMVKGYDEAAAGDLDALAVSAPDDDTFVVELSSPCVYFSKICAFAVLSPVQQATIEANGDEWAINPETYVCNGAYKTGELQMIKDVPTEEIPSLQGNEEFYIDPIMGTYYISFNTQREPFGDAKVRQALSLAIDRKYVAETLMQGTYSPATNFVGPGISDAEPGTSFEETTVANNGGNFFNVDDYEADLQKAKDLLAEAGYPDGAGFPTIEYMTNDMAYHKPLAEYLQSAWKELGVNMDIKIVEWSTFTPTRRNGDFDIARNGWVYDYDDPSNMLNLFETSNGNNDGKYSSASYDELIEKARNTADVAEHYSLLHEAENQVLADSAMAPVAYYNDFWLQSSKLKGSWHSPYGYWYFMYGTLEQ